MGIDTRPDSRRMGRTVDGGYIYRGVPIRRNTAGRWLVHHDGEVFSAKDAPDARYLVDKLLAGR